MPLGRELFQTYTSMPNSPMATTSTGPSAPPYSTATAAATDHVYVAQFSPTTIAYGQTAVCQYSAFVEGSNPGLMQYADDGNVMGTLCW